MKIKRVECDQFAGIQGRELEFDNGLNIVVGDNESGKSTMVDLIYQVLFQNVKLDGRSDGDFINKYFPKKVSGPQGDVIDGVIIFETLNGTYKLKKEWEKGKGSCRLTLPDGTLIKNNSDINKILNEELKHRAGVYNEIVFASQKRKQIAVESIMRELSKKSNTLSDTRGELASTLTRVSLETGGVSLEKIEKALNEKMNKLIGRWDRKANAPEGGTKRASYKHKWEKGVGLITEAYYEMDEVRTNQKETEEAERAVEVEKARIQKLQKEKKEIEEKKESFQNFRGLIEKRNLLSNIIEGLGKEIEEYKKAISNWPNLEPAIIKAEKLKRRQKQAAIHDLYLNAQPVWKEIDEKTGELKDLKEVDRADIEELRTLLFEKQNEESKLSGMNLVASINQLGTLPIEIKSASYGKPLNVIDGEVKIAEAVDIIVPGVLEMQLKPQGVNVEKVKFSIRDIESKIEKIHGKYGIDDINELQGLENTYLKTKKKIEGLERDLIKILGNKTWEDVKAENDSVPADIETEADIERQIVELCRDNSVDVYIGGLKKTLENYEKKYGNIENLRIIINKKKTKKVENQDQLDSIDEIPKEFQGIENPKQYNADLQNMIGGYDREIEECRANLDDANRNLGKKSAEEYSDELREKEAELEDKKTEYEHWLNIYNVFCRLKEQISGNPVEDIAEKFSKYLDVITEGGLELNSMDEQMTVQLASGTHALTYDILSDGTKDTISLAFRLAMLEHLYPEGDGLAVFDDPFTDMDPKRVEQSCRLIQRFAENNQVIFITCDEKYKKLMEGKEISVTNYK